jgi:Fe-S cluster assembly protein SufD
MIAEKSHTAQTIIDKISGTASKVGFLDDRILSEALLYLENNGIPNNKHEDYKYCNLDLILKKEFKDIRQEFIAVTDINSYKIQGAINLVLINGNFAAHLSDTVNQKGLLIHSFNELDTEGKKNIATLADVETDAFIALNTAFCSNGFQLRLEKGCELSMPLNIIYISSASSEALVNTRNLIQLEESSRAFIIEQQVVIGENKIFTNYLSEKFIAANASLESILIQNEGPSGYAVNTNQVLLNSNSVYDNTTITLSGQVVRNNHNVVLNGQNSEAHLYGLFSTRDNQLVDNHTLMDHRVPHCESNELYKGIVNGKSTGVFNGKIFVRKDAQKTNAYQSSKNILLSDDASVYTKPQLEIYADDVKCSHGTSTGKIDDNAMFYLNARGIGKESARKMLLASFALEVINKIKPESLRTQISEQFEKDI